ncbi:MAG: hypothetical protein GF346_05175 [Candidatus Eisenbacteria bacterium]|nr:hypothetical protein [Candidatus Latescibacterota bacterium]MBD3301818.1 hypothetical protein [Candidatus Eisenbacteria bacterium]
MNRNARTTTGIVTLCLFGLLAFASTGQALDIEVTGSAGAYVDRGNGWEEATDGMVLSTCNNIRLPGNYAWLDWKRVGGCGNEGRIETGLSRVKDYHVGTDITGNKQQNQLNGGFMDLLVSPEGTSSDATIVESPGCQGVDHCGINAGFAAVAALDQTPDDQFTTFSGCLAQIDPELQVALFYNHPTSPIPVFVETYANNGLFELWPGSWAEVFPDGRANIYEGEPPPCEGEEPTATEQSTWGRIKSMYQ